MSKSIAPGNNDHAPYPNSVDKCSAQLPDDNDHTMYDGTTVFEKTATDQQTFTELNLP